MAAIDPTPAADPVDVVRILLASITNSIDVMNTELGLVAAERQAIANNAAILQERVQRLQRGLFVAGELITEIRQGLAGIGSARP